MKQILLISLLILFISCSKDEDERNTPVNVTYLVECELCTIQYTQPDGSTESLPQSSGGNFTISVPYGTKIELTARNAQTSNGSVIVTIMVNGVITAKRASSGSGSLVHISGEAIVSDGIRPDHDDDDNDNGGSSGCGYYNGKKVFEGPRGGCYYINKNGNKTYVDRSYCNC